MLNQTITTHNGHTFTFDGYNKISKKINEHQTIYTLLNETETQQIKTANTTIRNIIEKTQTLFLKDEQTNQTHLINIPDYQEHLPDIEDYHYPI